MEAENFTTHTKKQWAGMMGKCLIESQATNTGEKYRFSYESLKQVCINELLLLVVTIPNVERWSPAVFKVECSLWQLKLRNTLHGGTMERYCNDKQPYNIAQLLWVMIWAHRFIPSFDLERQRSVIGRYPKVFRVSICRVVWIIIYVKRLIYIDVKSLTSWI